MKIREIIVAEGRDDIAAIKRAVDAEIIATGGSRINKATLDTIEKAYKAKGIIILTDPDYQGEKIRKRIKKLCPKAKEAFIARDEAEKKGDIGIENASPEAIRKALENAQATKEEGDTLYEKKDLVKDGLVGMPDSKERREIFTKALGIGYVNGKQLVSRLNSFGIEKEAYDKALEKVREAIDG